MTEIKLVGAERDKLDFLFEKKVVEYTRVYSAHRDWARILGERGEISAGIARAKGFLLVASSPLTRSSYHAGDDFERLRAAREERLARA